MKNKNINKVAYYMNKTIVAIFFALTVIFLFAHNSFAATYYVDATNGNDANSGADWANAFQTIYQATTVMAIGDIIEIAAGTYSEQVIASVDSVTFQGTSDPAYSGDVIINSPSNGFQIQGNNITVQNLKITGGGGLTTRRGFLVTGNNFTAENITIYDYSGSGFSFESGATNFTLTNVAVKDVGAYALTAQAGSAGTVKQSVFRGYADGSTPGAVVYLTGAGADVNFYDTVVMGGYRYCVKADTSAQLLMRNSIVAACGEGYTANSSIYSVYTDTTASADLDYSIIDGYGRFPNDYNYYGNVTVGSNLQTNEFPYFNGFEYNEAYFAITVDDRTNVSNADSIAAVLDDLGYHLTFNVNTPTLIDSADWATIQDLVNRGHDIGGHSYGNHHIDNTAPFTITYNGTDTNVAVTVSGNSTSFSITGDTGVDNVGPLDLTDPAYNPLPDLCTYIDGLANYSCDLIGASAVEYTSYHSNTLQDTTTSLATGVATEIPYDRRMPSAGGRFFTEALVDTKAAIESNIGGGYTVVSFAYPGQAHDSTARDAVEDAGYSIARGSSAIATSAHKMDNISDIFMALMSITTDEVKGSGYDTLTSAEQEERIRSFARAWSVYALQNGISAALTIHTSDTMNATEVGWLVDELVKNGIQIKSMREIYQAISSGWTTSDNRSYTKTYSDSLDLTYKSYSPAVDAGTTISGITTDLAGNPIYGTPDIGPYEYQPTLTMGTDKPDISSAIRIYQDGKYRYTSQTTGSTNADLTVMPSGGFSTYGATDTRPAFLDISVTTWNTSGDYSKEWTETGTTSTGTTSHVVGDLNPGDYYTVRYIHASDPEATLATYQADSNGQISFDYTGGYSTVTFTVDPDTTGPNSFDVVSPSDYFVTSASRPTLSWNSTTDDESGMAKYQLFIDGQLDTDNISTSTTEITPSGTLICGPHTWYIRAVDNAGNTTDTSVYNLTKSCSTPTVDEDDPEIVALSSPVDDEKINAGYPVKIQWNSVGKIKFVNLYYSNDGKKTFSEIVKHTANDGEYVWKAPSDLSGSVAIKIELTDLSSAIASDMVEVIICKHSASADNQNSSDKNQTDNQSNSTHVNPFTGEEEEITEVSVGDFITSPETDTVYYID
ncbi:hypothetical protein D6827_02650, partial [Candidatus Parcubacteria bacterium]